MKIQYIGKGKFQSNGLICSETGSLHDVKDEQGEYLVKTFPGKFNLIEPTTKKSEEPKEAKPSRRSKKVADEAEGKEEEKDK